MMIDRQSLYLMFSGRLHPQGWLFVRWGAFLFAIFFFLSKPLAILTVFCTVLIALFFRDPNRVSPDDTRVIVSPADGLIVDISIVSSPPEELKMPAAAYHKVSIFLNLWDVHVNRIPLAGKVIRKTYHKGSFSHAASEEAGLSNERLGIVIKGKTIVGCVQIAGFLARRIVCDVDVEDEVEQGQRYGIICFGSRLDCYILEKYPLWVKPHQRMIAGETILAGDL